MTEETKIIRAARIDKDGVYMGMDELEESALTPFHLPQIDDCDLPPGKYRWSEASGAFIPIEAAVKKVEPNALAAMLGAFEAIEKSGVALPQVTKEWMASFKQTWDGQQ